MNRKQRRARHGLGRHKSGLMWDAEQPRATAKPPQSHREQIARFARGEPLAALGRDAEAAVRVELRALADSMNVTSDIIRRAQALVLERVGSRTWPKSVNDSVACPSCRKNISIPSARRDAYESGVRSGTFALENFVGHLFNMVCIMQLSSVSGGASVTATAG